MSPRIVWILGSGFSKSLGGPLLYDLLTPRGRAETEIRFGVSYPKVYQIYKKLRKSKVDEFKRLGIWEHAEEFLSFADTLLDRGTSENPWSNFPRRKLIEPHVEALGLKGEAFRADAIKAVACECMFTRHANLNEEAWQPYIDWTSSLDDNNTIITFNYDVVLEELAKKEKCKHLDIVPPQGPERIRVGQRRVRVLKLHGSCNWFLRAKEKTIATPDIESFGEFIKTEVPLIGIPGPTKKLHRDTHFKNLWTQAENALRDAQVIVFLGYRFPPSDSEALKYLLGAIAKMGNQAVSKKVYTVLGPNTADEATSRLAGLLRATLHRNIYKPHDDPFMQTGDLQYQIITEPLYVEDFLSVTPVDQLEELPRITYEYLEQLKSNMLHRYR